MVWAFRLPITMAGLRYAGLGTPKVEAIDITWPNTLTFRAAAGDADGLLLEIEKGSLAVTGWQFWGRGLAVVLNKTSLTLPRTFPPPDSEPADPFRFDPYSWLPPFALLFKDFTVLSPEPSSVWAEGSGALSSGPIRKLELQAKTVIGNLDFESQVESTEGTAQIVWTAPQSPQWEKILPTLSGWGIEIAGASGLKWSEGATSAEASWGEGQTKLSADFRGKSLRYTTEDLSIRADSLRFNGEAVLGKSDPTASGSGELGPLTVSAGDTQFEANEIKIAVQPDQGGILAKLQTEDAQATLSEVDLTGITGEIEILRRDSGAMSSTSRLGAQVFSGSIDTVINTQLAPFALDSATINLSAVSLGQINERFQFFDGKVEAKVRGSIEVEWNEGVLTVLPSQLEMLPGTEGTLQYFQTGWMTGDPELDIEKISNKLRIDQLLSRPDGTGILVELAARNLTVTRLQITIFEQGQREKEGEIDLEGFSLVKGTKIPVVLTIPLRGDLQESIRLLIQAGAMM